MALRRGKVEARGPVRLSLTAAGRLIDVADDAVLRAIRGRPMGWQKLGYALYDSMGEAWFASNYVGNSMSRLRLYAAVQPDPESDPISITSESLDPADAPPDEEIEVVLAALRRLNNTHGGIADIFRGAGLNNFIAGESFVIGRQVDDFEEWEVHSVSALEVDDSGRAVALKLLPEDPKDKLVPLRDENDASKNAMVVRIWRRHPQWPELPDSAMRPGSEYLEDLKALTAGIRAAAWSRVPAGILKLPLEASEGQADTTEDPNAEGDSKKDPLLESIIEHMSAAKKNPKDASALVPFLLQLSKEDLGVVDKIEFSREIDKLAVDLRRESRESYATTVDLPADVMTGKAGLNHWTAWNVDKDAFRTHLAPHAETIVDGLTAGYLWPVLGLAGVEDRRRYRLWYDPTELVTDPDNFDHTLKMHERIVVSDAALRRAGGADDDDAPDDDEVERRIEIARSTRAPVPGDSAPASTTDTESPPAQTASALVAAPSGISLGERLAGLELSLMQRLLAAADAELRRVLERVGNRVVTASRRGRGASPVVAELIGGAATVDVCSRLGPAHVAALVAADPSDPGAVALSLLGDDAFDSLRDRWETWTRRAQEEALAAIARAGRPIEPEQLAELKATMSSDRDAAFALFAASLAAVAAERIFDSSPGATVGEVDTSRLLQAGALRDALARAGGGPVLEKPTAAEAPGGLLSGQTIADAFRAAALELGEWVWLYGDPSSRSMPFEPHLALDGETFPTWDDEVLRNDEGFPDVDFYRPGDHSGCQCTFARDGSPIVADEEE